MERSNSGIIILLLYLLVAVYMFPLFPDAGSANELTDWATAVALVENNSLNVKPVETLAGIKVSGPVESIGDGRYSTKAPGIALLSAPFYALTRIITGAPNPQNLVSSWFVLRVLFGTVPLFLLGFWLYNREIDSYSLAVLLFATPLLFYSLVFYSHVFVAILVYMAFRLLYDARRVFPETCFWAAAILGVAIACEYTAVIPAVILGFGLVFSESRDRFRRIVFFIAGIVPALLALAIFNYLVFGSPLAFLYYADVAIPSLHALYLFLVSPSHGILVFSPVLLLGALALLGSNESGTARHNVKSATVLVTFILLSGIALKFGGDAVGPRHLILIMPLLLDSFFDGEIEEYPSLPRGVIFAVSFVFCALPILTYPFASPELQFPHNSFWMPLLIRDSAYAPTLANNLGFAVSIWTLMPALIALLAVPYLVWRDAKYPVRFGLGTLLGFTIVIAYLFSAPLESDAAKPRRLEAQRTLISNKAIK